MCSFLDGVDAFMVALPHVVEAIKTMAGAIEEIVLRLALHWFFLYGVYKTLRSS